MAGGVLVVSTLVLLGSIGLICWRVLCRGFRKDRPALKVRAPFRAMIASLLALLVSAQFVDSGSSKSASKTEHPMVGPVAATNDHPLLTHEQVLGARLALCAAAADEYLDVLNGRGRDDKDVILLANQLEVGQRATGLAIGHEWLTYQDKEWDDAACYPISESARAIDEGYGGPPIRLPSGAIALVVNGTAGLPFNPTTLDRQKILDARLALCMAAAAGTVQKGAQNGFAHNEFGTATFLALRSDIGERAGIRAVAQEWQSYTQNEWTEEDCPALSFGGWARSQGYRGGVIKLPTGAILATVKRLT